MSEFARHPDAGAVFGHCLLVRGDGEVMQIMKASTRLLQMSAIGSSIYQPSVFVRREVLNAHGFVNPAFQVAMDYELWVRLMS